MIEQLFEVATEFRFDVGQALVNTQALQKSVDGLAQSTNTAFTGLNFLASNLVSHLGLGSGGLISVLTKSVQLAEEFDGIALDFASNINANLSTLAGHVHGFNQQLESSHMLMGKVTEQANKFGLPMQTVAMYTQMLANPLANAGKLGTNYENAIKLARNTMLASETSRIHPQMAVESLMHGLSDRMPIHGKLFARLANTLPFKQGHITTQGQLTTMKTDAKIDLLSKAMEALAMNADALNFRMHRIGTQFTIMKNHLMTVFGPFGQTMRNALVRVMEGINHFLDKNGKVIGQNVARLFDSLLQSPRNFLVTLMQFRKVGEDFHKSLHMVELYGTYRFLKMIATTLGFSGKLFQRLAMTLGGWFLDLIKMVPWAALISGTFRLLRLALVEVGAPLIAFMSLFQILSRARAKAKVDDIAALTALIPQITAVTLKWKIAIQEIFGPFFRMIEFWSDLLSFLFRTSTYLKILVTLGDGLGSVFKMLGDFLIYWRGFWAGLIESIIGGALDVVMLHKLPQVGKHFMEGWRDYVKENLGKLDEKPIVANQVTNIGSMTANFDMKEQLEPDRIAFAVTEHLKKLASNPQQGRGNTFRAPSTGAAAFSGAR
jgi:hypothetical protein